VIDGKWGCKNRSKNIPFSISQNPIKYPIRIAIRMRSNESRMIIHVMLEKGKAMPSPHKIA